MTSLISTIQEVKVSSVLNNDRRVYGKKFLFDGKDETCWNSDQGSPQWIKFSFPQLTVITQLKLQFQGGFVGKECSLEVSAPETNGISPNTNGNKPILPKFQFAPEDSNSVQVFSLEEPLTSQQFRLSFNTSTDFYGRIILYNCDIIGTPSNS